MTASRTAAPTNNGRASAGVLLADLARVKALFQARTIAKVIGAEPPAPEAFVRAAMEAASN